MKDLLSNLAVEQQKTETSTEKELGNKKEKPILPPIQNGVMTIDDLLGEPVS